MKAELKVKMKEAMKAKDKNSLNTIRAILSAIQYEEIQQKSEDLPQETLIAILKNEEKKRIEGIELYSKADRADDVAQLEAELVCVRQFLPEQLSEDALRKLIEEFKTAQPEANMGLAMKHLKENFNGQYDGRIASQVAKELFA